ncbi:MAG: hypothetical protein AB1502_16265 [Thermodesulfobacteriota bacterium]
MKKKTFLGYLFLVFSSTLFVSCATTPDLKEEETKEISHSFERIGLPEYKVGETWEWRWIRGQEGHSWTNKVVGVKENEIVAVTGKGDKLFLDNQYNILKATNPKGEDVTQNFWWERWFWFKNFPLHVGKKWKQIQKGVFYIEAKRVVQEYEITYEVEGFEEVNTPVGGFNAAKILTTLTTEDKSGKGKVTLKVNMWYSKEVKNYVMGEWEYSPHWVPEWQGVVFKLSKFEPSK